MRFARNLGRDSETFADPGLMGELKDALVIGTNEPGAAREFVL